VAVDRVESARFPYLPVAFTVRGSTRTAEALVDTGFDGYLAVPEALLRGVAPSGHQMVGLADGSALRIPYYRGLIRLGELSPVPCLIITLGDEVIVGRRVTDRYYMVFDRGRRVIVEP
jgi:predicted aspartyl protease